MCWQPGRKPTDKDYLMKAPSKRLDSLMNHHGFSASGSLGIWAVLDVPKNKKDKYRKFEKVYFAPMFEKTSSYSKTNDSLQFEMQNIFFDMDELWARWARWNLDSIKTLTNATVSVSIMYETIRTKMKRNSSEMFVGYFQDVWVDKREGAFIEWRAKIDELLKENTKWATRPEECHRLLTGEPIEKGYVEAQTRVGPKLNREE